MTALTGATVVTPEGVLVDGWVLVEGDQIQGVGQGSAPEGPTIDLRGGWLLPGFIDIHCHGGSGHDFASGDPAEIEAATRFHAQHGTTGMLASLVTAHVDDLCRQLEAIADAMDRPDSLILGAHLEGPFLSPDRCGAQNPMFLLQPDRGVLTRLLEAGRGILKMITIAPELPGALELVEEAASVGIVVAIGHTAATFEQATDAVHRGARVATHLFNGMTPLHHREPGPVLAALDAGLACELINDGAHVHPGILRLVAAYPHTQLLLVTDAISAAGMGTGLYQLGGQAVIVENGIARLVTNGSLAGSTLTMDRAFAAAVRESGLSIQTVAAAAATNPARVLGLSAQRGAISEGRTADLVHLAQDLTLLGTMTQGRWQS